MIKTILMLMSGFTTLVGADFKQAQTVTDKVNDSVNNSSFKNNDVEAHPTPPTLPFSSSTSMVSLPGEGDPSSGKPWYGSLTPSPPPDNAITGIGRYLTPPSQYEQRTKSTIAAGSTTARQVISTSAKHTLPSLAESILHTEGTSYTTFSASMVPKTSVRVLPSTSTSAGHLTTKLEVQTTTTSVTGPSSGTTQNSTSLDRTWPSYANTKTRNDVTSTTGSSQSSSIYDTLFSSTKSTIQTVSLGPPTEAPKSSTFSTAEVLTSLIDHPGISRVKALTSEVSLTFRSGLSIVVTSNTLEVTTHGAASRTSYWQHSGDKFLTETDSRAGISSTTQTVVGDSSIFATKAMTDSGAGTFTTPSKYSSNTDEGLMASNSYFPASSSEGSPISDPEFETSHAVLKETTPPTTGAIGTLNETNSGHHPIPSQRLNDRPGIFCEVDESTFVTTVPSAASSSMIRPAVKYATSNSKFVENTSTAKSADGTSIVSSVVSDVVQTSPGSSVRANWPSMLPVTTVGSIADSSELDPTILPTQNRPVHGTDSVSPTISSNHKTYSQPPKGNEQSSQGQKANTIGIATGAVSASVMCGIIVFLIARHYKTKKTHRPFSIRILTNSSQKSLDSGTTSTGSSTTMNERGRGWGSKPYPSHNRRNGSFDKRIISSPLSGGNSLGL